MIIPLAQLPTQACVAKIMELCQETTSVFARSRKYLSGPGLGPVLIKAVVGTAGLRLIGMGFGLLVGVQLARGLGAAGYGVYGVAMAVTALLTVPTEFGLPQLVTREVAAAQVHQDWSRAHGILKWSLRATLVISVLVSSVVVAWLLVSGEGTGSTLGLTVLAGLLMIPLVSVGNVNGAALRGMQHIVKGQLPDSLIRPVAFSALLFLVSTLQSPLNPVSAMGAGVASAALACVGAAWMLQSHLPLLGAQDQVPTHSRAWWASAFPMAMTEGMRQVQGNAAILVMGALVTEVAVGVFRVAVSISALVWVPATLFNLVGSPVISRLHASGDKVKLQRLLGWLSAGMTAGAFLMSLPFFVSGGALLAMIFGAEFSESREPLIILALGCVISSAFGPAIVLLNMTGHERRVTRAFTLSVFALLLTAFPLIRLFGGNGAATANALAAVLGAFVTWRDASQLLGIDSSILAFFRGGNRHA